MSQQTSTLSVSTTALKSLLADKPEVLLRLQAMATEKIAEEITRKAANIDLGFVNQQVKQIINAELAHMKRSWTMPDEIKKSIQVLVEDAVTASVDKHRQATEKRVNDMVRHAEDRMQSRMEDRIRQFGADMQKMIQATARNEFMGVVREVQGTISNV